MQATSTDTSASSFAVEDCHVNALPSQQPADRRPPLFVSGPFPGVALWRSLPRLQPSCSSGPLPEALSCLHKSSAVWTKASGFLRSPLPSCLGKLLLSNRRKGAPCAGGRLGSSWRRAPLADCASRSLERRRSVPVERRLWKCPPSSAPMGHADTANPGATRPTHLSSRQHVAGCRAWR
eukprot:scaffold44_cov411-Prasinococcus_capsulatus_cf.AAC.1